MNISLERIGVESAPIVQKIYENSPGYFLKTEHTVAGKDAALNDLNDKVPIERRTTSYEKLFLLITIDNVPAGIVDLHKNHPQKEIIYVGLFLLIDQFQHKGLGLKCFTEIENYIRKNTECTHLRLGVSTDNDVEGFWCRVGFTRNGHTYKWNGANRVNDVFEMEKKL